jgi:hypothetical protein
MGMDERRPLDRGRIEEAFRFRGQYLLDRKTLGEIAIYRGSAILFQFDWRKTSLDVDARVISAGNHTLVIEAVHETARRLDLPRSWLNESVAVYARRGEDEHDRVLVGALSFRRTIWPQGDCGQAVIHISDEAESFRAQDERRS